MICICRAILKRSKVVILDEATANIDQKTEERIQQLIDKEFKDCTVMTVAHRLKTVMNSDKILVTNEGQNAEFDSPQALLASPKSLFSHLVKSLKN